MQDDDPPPLPVDGDAAPAAPAGPSRLRRTLHTLRTPFRSGSPFHISAIKRTGSTKSSASDSEVLSRVNDMRKRNKKKQDSGSTASGTSRSNEGSPESDKKQRDGSFVRRLGSLGRRREAAPATISEPTPALSVDADKSDGRASPPAEADNETTPPIPDLTVEHPVATKPFTKSAWKRRGEVEMTKPVEEPSPESALRRRIAFVEQASTWLSEERGEPDAVGSLEEAVALARARLGAASATPAPSVSPHSNVGDDTEEEGFVDAMPPYGDLIEPGDRAGGPTTASHATSSGGERREHLYKILVIGELGTGKTSIIKRYVHQFFSQHYRATIGVDFALKVLNWDANTIIRLQLWDIAGQERFGNMTRVYYKEAVGAFIVFDVTRVATFDAVVKWKNDLDAKVQLPDGSSIPCVLLANKCDQQKEGIVNTAAKMDEYCREKGFAGWFETSAKENINIEEAARSLVNKILLNDKLLHNNDSKDNERFALDHKIANGDNENEGGNKSCSC